MKAIEVKNLTRTFGHLVAVDHISFAVEEGEIFGFLGANGVGKTTTIMMLTTALNPTSGNATVCGHDIVKEMYIDPLTYGVDGLRGALVGGGAFPLWLDFTVLGVLSIALAGLGAYLFSKMEVD